MNKKNYIDKIELILNTSGKYITRKEKDMILDYVNYFKTKNNVIEDKNIELVIEIERLNNIIKEVREYIEKYDFITGYYEYNYDDENDTYTHYTVKEELLEILDKVGSDKE